MKIKTVKALIKVCEAISEIDREELKGVKLLTSEQYDQIGFLRAAVQDDLHDLKILMGKAKNKNK